MSRETGRGGQQGHETGLRRRRPLSRGVGGRHQVTKTGLWNPRTEGSGLLTVRSSGRAARRTNRTHATEDWARRVEVFSWSSGREAG